MRSSFRCGTFVALACMAFAVPASARNWESPNGIDWTDLDSASRVGDIVTYSVATGDSFDVPPGPNTRISENRINCRTMNVSRVVNGAVQTWLAHIDSPARRFCRNVAATAPRRPWTHLDSSLWMDPASVRRDGQWSSFDAVPGPEDGVNASQVDLTRLTRLRYNCSTRVRQFQRDGVWNGGNEPLPSPGAARYSRLLCR